MPGSRWRWPCRFARARARARTTPQGAAAALDEDRVAWAVAHASDLPVILYDVPSRSASAIADATVAALYEVLWAFSYPC